MFNSHKANKLMKMMKILNRGEPFDKYGIELASVTHNSLLEIIIYLNHNIVYI